MMLALAYRSILGAVGWLNVVLGRPYIRSPFRIFGVLINSGMRHDSRARLYMHGGLPTVSNDNLLDYLASKAYGRDVRLVFGYKVIWWERVCLTL